MTDDVTITLFLGVFALIIVSWAWYLYSVRRVEITKEELNSLINIEFDKEYLKQRLEVFDEPKKRPQVRKATTRKEKDMPLVKSAKPAAFKKNVATEVKAGKPVKQAVAIGYAVQREAEKKKGKKK